MPFFAPICASLELSLRVWFQAFEVRRPNVSLSLSDICRSLDLVRSFRCWGTSWDSAELFRGRDRLLFLASTFGSLRHLCVLFIASSDKMPITVPRDVGTDQEVE
jgi:hypothetical protein